MDSAKFKTLRVALGFTIGQVASILETDSDTVRAWEEPGGKVPDFASDWLGAQWQAMAEQVELVIDTVQDQIDKTGEPEVVNLSRYVDDEQAHNAEPGLTVRRHQAITSYIAMLLELEGIDFNIAWAPTEPRK